MVVLVEIDTTTLKAHQSLSLLFLRQKMNTTRQQQTGLFSLGSFSLGKYIRSKKGDLRNRKAKLTIHILSRNYHCL